MVKKRVNSLDRVKNISLTKMGALIRNERKRRKITQAELANLAGLGLNFISHIENGKETAHIGKVLHVLKVLGFEVEVKARA